MPLDRSEAAGDVLKWCPFVFVHLSMTNTKITPSNNKEDTRAAAVFSAVFYRGAQKASKLGSSHALEAVFSDTCGKLLPVQNGS